MRFTTKQGFQLKTACNSALFIVYLVIVFYKDARTERALSFGLIWWPLIDEAERTTYATFSLALLIID